MKHNFGRIMLALALCALLCLSCVAPALADEMTKGMAFGKYSAIPAGFNELHGSFKTPSRGYVKLTLSGEFYTAKLYKGDQEVWSARTLYLKEGKWHIFYIGLARGSYRLQVRGGEGAKAKVEFTKNSNYEIEPNNESATATTLKLGTYYGGFYGDNDSSWAFVADDFYKVKLQKGVKYTLQFTQYKKLFAYENSTAYLLVIDSNGTNVVSVDGEYQMKGSTLPTNGRIKFSVKKSGWYRIRLKPDRITGAPFSYKIRIK